MKRDYVKIFKFIPLLALAFVGFSCSDEDNPTAFDGEEPVVHDIDLPQGSHSYDDTIMIWHEKYGTYPLYKFDDNDWCWNVTYDIRWYYDASNDKTNGGYKVNQADENFVGPLLQMIDKEVFCYFPDTLLNRILPLKVLLASTIVQNPGSLHGEVPVSDYILINTLSGMDYLAFAGARAHIDSLTEAEVSSFRTDGVKMVLDYATDMGLIGYDATFATITDYSQSYTATAALRAGLLNQYALSASSDWKSYISAIVSTPYATLKSRYLDQYPNIDKKYQLVVDYFKQRYNVDLQLIGNRNE